MKNEFKVAHFDLAVFIPTEYCNEDKSISQEGFDWLNETYQQHETFNKKNYLNLTEDIKK